MRVLATFCLAFAATITAKQYLLAPQWLLPLAFVAAVMGLLGFCLRGKRRMRVFLLAAGVISASLYGIGYDYFVATPAQAYVGTTQTLTLELTDYPQETAYGARCEVRIPSDDISAIYYGERALLYHAPGEQLTVQVACKSAARPDDEGDVLTTFTSRGIHLLLYNEGEERYEAADAGALRYLPQRAAHRIGALIDQLYTERTASFFHALLLGDRTRLSERDASNLSEAGIYHITAVSGLHCGFLLAVAVFFITRKYERLLCAVTMAALFFYTLLTGASPSAVRASIMLSLVVIAPLFNRETDGLTSLSFSLFLILLANPYAITSVSLQLSYAAVSGILFLTPKLIKKIGKRTKIVRLILTSFAVTLGACVFSLPLSAYYFGRIALVMFLGNLLCLGMVSLAFVGGFAAVLLGAVFLPLGNLAAAVVSLAALYTLEVAGALASLPYHALYLNHPIPVLWLCYVYVLFAACVLLRGGRYRYHVASVLAVVTLVASVSLTQKTFRGDTLHVFVLDVGQGQSVLVMKDDYAALIDCGSSTSYVDAGDLAADYLLTAGHRSLDALALTHGDADHTNGIELLSARIAVENIYAPATQKVDTLGGQMLSVELVSDRKEVGEGAVGLSLYPSHYSGSKDNETGLAALLEYHDFTLLVTGDMPSAAEEQLLRDYTIGDVDVLLVGHHGSKRATSRNVLKELSPEVGVISVGQNSYGHPAEETLYRLSDIGAAVYRTDLQGNIHIEVN